MMKITYRWKAGSAAVACDMSTKRADTVHKVYDKYTITIPELKGVVIAGPSLLLADKIRTLAERNISCDVKMKTDMVDIRHCLRLMLDYNIKMDPLLRSLYSSDQWQTVRSRLESSTPPGALAELIKEAETRFEIIA